MLKSALGSVRENSNNPSVVLNVWFLTFCLLLCEWNTSMEVFRCVRVVDMCVYRWCLRGRNHLSTCRKCLTLSSSTPLKQHLWGPVLGNGFTKSPRRSQHHWTLRTTSFMSPHVAEGFSPSVSLGRGPYHVPHTAPGVKRNKHQASWHSSSLCPAELMLQIGQ